MGQMKKILMACCNYWNSPFQVGSHHIAKGFLDLGWEVAFISDPISPLHLLTGVNSELKERYKIYQNNGVRYYNNRLWTYVPGSLCTPHNKPVLKSEWIYKKWFKLTYPNVISQIKNQGFGEVDLVYLDSVTQSFWLDNLKYKKAIFRVADKNIGFAKFSDNTRNVESEIAQKVDTVIYTAHKLKKYVLDMKPRQILHVPNGVNFDHFVNGDKAMPDDMKNIPKPIAIYVGAIAEWFDYELIMKAAHALPKASFVLIGPDKMARERLKPLSNIYLLGRKEYQEVPAYLHNADIGLIPFNVKQFPDLVHSINPLKLYEYMACGLPTVSTEWEELKLLHSPSVLSKDDSEFISAISNITNSKQMGRESYIDYARQHKWSYRIEELINFLSV